MPRSEPGRQGLTLLEVMAAVAVLGLFYTVLADVAMQGLRAEGEASRRLAASLLADQALTELETALEDGTLPPLGRTQVEQEDFRISVEVASFEVPLREEKTPARAREPEIPGTSLLLPAARGAPGPLRRINVQVSWVEGPGERAVSRTTFAFDRESVRTELDALDAAVGAQGETAGGRPGEELGPGGEVR